MSKVTVLSVLLSTAILLPGHDPAAGRDPVLPSLQAGSIKFSPKPMQKLAFVYSRPGIEAFDPSVQGISATIGSDEGDFGPSIAPGAPWKGKKGRYSLKMGSWKLVVDAPNGLVTFKMKTDNGGMFTNPITVRVDVGGVTGETTVDWSPHPKRAGCFSYP